MSLHYSDEWLTVYLGDTRAVMAAMEPESVNCVVTSPPTGMVANELGRRAVLIDLSAEYLDQAIKRLAESRSKGHGPSVDMPVPFADDGLWAEVS